jgi:hypothetical protein
MSEGVFSRGFRSRRKPSDTSGRLPLGQYLERGFPVLSAGPTPHTPLANWDFSIVGEVDQPKRWSWEELRALPREMVTKDIHCVTKWSKFDTHWGGVSPSIPGSRRSPQQPATCSPFPMEAIPPTRLWTRCSMGRHGSLTHMKASLWIRNMVARPACWFLTFTSGRAPSGCGACA